jgi:ankyrin repeat protein
MKTIHEAARYGLLEDMETLFRNGADLNAKRKGGLTPLHEATIFLGMTEVAEFLLSHGARVDLTDDRGRAALHYASGLGHLEVADLLIAHGANVNIQERWGETPLHWAALEGHLNMVKLLLGKGADANLADNKGETAAFWAMHQGHHDVSAMLRQSVPRPMLHAPYLKKAYCRPA